MSAPRAFEHAQLRVNDLGAALDFYLGPVGLVEIAREGGVVYLGCGLDENYDVALVGGGTGVEHFAILVSDEAELERHAARLVGAGVRPERRDGREPGQEQGLRFTLPTGHVMELVVAADCRYLVPSRPARGARSGMTLVDVDHINLCSGDVRGLAEFLRDVLDFRFSDLIVLESGELFAAWTRYGQHHHDVAILPGSPAETLHHLAWTCSSLDHMKLCCDLLSACGLRLELGIGRHPVGSNLFAYFWDPGGNRSELTAEVARLDPTTPTRVWSSPLETLDAWGEPVVPESFRRGS